MSKSTVLIVLAASVAQAQTAPAETAEAVETAQWNEAAAQELESFTRQMFKSWQAEDAEAVRAAIAADAMLGTYDNDMKGVPVKIANVDEQIRFAQQMWGDAKKMGAKVTGQIKTISCQATETMGVCAVEFEIHVALSDGGTRKYPTRGTMISRLGDDGWEATHWHASPAAPPPSPKPEPPAPIAPLSASQKGLEWKEIPDSGGLKTALVWEDPATGTRVSYMRFPRRWKQDRHYHSAASHNVLLKGAIDVTGADGLKEEHKGTSWAYVPGKWIHSTETKRGATVLSISFGPGDTVMVDEKGNPVSGAAPTAK